MRAVDIIVKKRDGGELTGQELEFFMQGYTRGEIPDYQAAAWAMAVLLNGMTPQETADLTWAMIATGDQLDLSEVVSIAVDKHSTGGVGDKTTLVVEPIVAACGVPVGKMSGRGLSFTGGTLDKMESISGFRTNLTEEEFLTQLHNVGLVLAGQTAKLAPADGKLYALRDVTGTVPSIPLIASSIMSKKLAAGTQAIVLDVKIGLGAFMHSVEPAIELSKAMLDIAKSAERKAVVLISDMNQPLGCTVGNALEVLEAIDTLHNGGPKDLREHCLEVAGHMLVLAGKAEELGAAKEMAADVLSNGRAFEKFRQLVEAQGGDIGMVDEPDRLPRAIYIETLPSPKTGYISQIHAGEVGLTAVELGAGREKKGDSIDHAVGIVIHHKVGDRIEKGDPLFTVHANDEERRDQAIERLLNAYKFSDTLIKPLPLFYKTIFQAE